MRRRDKIGIAGGVLAAGLGAAMLFRHDGAPPIEPAGPRGDGVVLRETQPGATEGAGAAERAIAKRQAAENMAPPTGPDVPPPLEPRYPGFSTPTFAANELPLVSRRESAPPRSKSKTHRIIDGDTLTSLAMRYLGDGRRYEEIFDANRDVLASPDLLPIGQIIQIPPHAEPPPPAASARPASLPLVPVPQNIHRGNSYP